MNKEVQAYSYLLNCIERAHNALMRSPSFDRDEAEIILSIQGLLKQLISRNSGEAIEESLTAEQPEIPATPPTQAPTQAPTLPFNTTMNIPNLRQQQILNGQIDPEQELKNLASGKEQAGY